MPVRILAVREALFVASSNGSGRLFGTVRPDEDLIQILSAEAHVGFPEIGRIAPDGKGAEGVRLLLPAGAFRLDLQEPVSGSVDVEVVELLPQLESRRKDLVSLADRSVLLVGAGSLGSLVGVLLAQAGVGRMVVLDPDRIDGANLSRHVCDLADLGRSKAVALAERLKRRCIAADSLEQDVLALPDSDLDRLVGQTDLVVATTDSMPAQFVVNETCVRAARPVVFSGAYGRAAGGEVIAYRPGLSPCLYCAVGFRAGILPAFETKQRREAYQAEGKNQMTAEPGLACDISFLAAVTAAYALALLDPTGCRAGLLRPGRVLLLHGGSDPQGDLAELFERPFEFVSAHVARPDPCPVCGWISKEG